MNTAKVISAGRVTIPNSGRDALQILTDKPYLVGGEVGTMTGIYVDPACPEPKTGDPVSWEDASMWKSGSAWVGGVRWRRYGYEFNPDAPLR